MSRAAVETFVDRMEKIVKIHMDAGDLTNAEVIGALEMLKLDIYMGIPVEDEGPKEEWRPE